MSIRKVFIGLMWLTVAACTKAPELAERPAPALLQIDSLMWQRPDSALALLLPYFDTCRDAMIASPTDDADNALETHSMRLYDRHYANLLLAELLYKNDYAQANRTALQQAVAYFDSLADTPDAAFLAARAHYINGVGYYEQDSVVEACREYLKALESMESHFGEKGMVGKKAKFMALTYTRLTDVFSDFYLHEQAIYFGKKSMVYYYKYDASPRHVSRMLNEIGSHYDMMNRFDSASFYYRKSLMVLPDTNNLTYRDIATLLAFLSYKTGEVPKTSLNQLKRLLGQSETPKEALSRCAIVGEIYYQEKQFDSAWIYLNKVFHKSQSADSKKQVAERLVEICKAQGREEEIIKYAGFLVPFATQHEDKGIIKTQLAELYNKHKQHELELQHRLKAKKQTIWSIGVVVGLLMLMLCTFVLYRQKYRRKKKSLEIQIKEEQYAHEIKQKALSRRLKQSNEALRIQEKKTYNLAKEIDIQQRQTAWNGLDGFMNESICKDILTALNDKQIKREAKNIDYPELRLSDVQLHDLSIAVEKHFCGFEKTMTDLYPKISRNTMYQCLLYILNLEDVQIAALLSCDYSTVKKRSAKLKQAFVTEKEPRQFIRELIL